MKKKSNVHNLKHGYMHGSIKPICKSWKTFTANKNEKFSNVISREIPSLCATGCTRKYNFLATQKTKMLFSAIIYSQYIFLFCISIVFLRLLCRFPCGKYYLFNLWTSHGNHMDIICDIFVICLLLSCCFMSKISIIRFKNNTW